MTIMSNATFVNSFRVNHEKLTEDLKQLLNNVDENLGLYALGSYSEAYEAMYKSTMRSGIESLIGIISIENNQAWNDAMEYAREVILAPQDTTERAVSNAWGA